MKKFINIMENFGTEQLPFMRFDANAAYYYFMAIAFLIFESFKEDVTKGIIDANSYATTFRKKLIDIVRKIVHRSGKIILKVSRAI